MITVNAEGSIVKAATADVKPTVENKTDSAVTVTDSKGQNATVEAGTPEITTPMPDSSDPGNNTDGSGSPGNPSKEEVPA